MDILNIMPQKSGNGHFKWIFKWINVEQNLEMRENHQVVSFLTLLFHLCRSYPGSVHERSVSYGYTSAVVAIFF